MLVEDTSESLPIEYDIYGDTTLASLLTTKLRLLSTMRRNNGEKRL